MYLPCEQVSEALSAASPQGAAALAAMTTRRPASAAPTARPTGGAVSVSSPERPLSADASVGSPAERNPFSSRIFSQRTTTRPLSPTRGSESLGGGASPLSTRRAKRGDGTRRGDGGVGWVTLVKGGNELVTWRPKLDAVWRRHCLP